MDTHLLMVLMVISQLRLAGWRSLRSLWYMKIHHPPCVVTSSDVGFSARVLRVLLPREVPKRESEVRKSKCYLVSRKGRIDKNQVRSRVLVSRSSATNKNKCRNSNLLPLPLVLYHGF
jgi:hypothetical protein